MLQVIFLTMYEYFFKQFLIYVKKIAITNQQNLIISLFKKLQDFIEAQNAFSKNSRTWNVMDMYDN